MSSETGPFLRCGALSLALAPAIGGSIAALDWTAPDGRVWPVLRSTPPKEGSVLDQASFPLVPFANRVRGGHFAFRDRAVQLTPNLSGDPSPLHGFGWTACWDVSSATEERATLRYTHMPGEWPWPFHAAQHFALDPAGLTVTLSCSNAGTDPMPCGLGLHPYFPCTPDTLLDAQVACAWTIDENTLPVEQVAAEGRYDLREHRICGAGLDNGFGGWSGRATLTDPAWPFAVALSSPEARFLHVYAPPAGNFVAVEPVGHANAALNALEERWGELGLKVLAPGESTSLTTRIGVTPVQ